MAARLTPACLEYAQARGFHFDPVRVRRPRDKGRVEAITYDRTNRRTSVTLPNGVLIEYKPRQRFGNAD